MHDEKHFFLMPCGVFIALFLKHALYLFILFQNNIF